MLQTLFPANMGSADRLIRGVVGFAALALVFVGPQTAFGWLGLIPLATAALGSCPLYTLFGVRTCPAKALRT